MPGVRPTISRRVPQIEVKIRECQPRIGCTEVNGVGVSPSVTTNLADAIWIGRIDCIADDYRPCRQSAAIDAQLPHSDVSVNPRKFDLELIAIQKGAGIVVQVSSTSDKVVAAQ